MRAGYPILTIRQCKGFMPGWITVSVTCGFQGAYFDVGKKGLEGKIKIRGKIKEE